MAYKRKIHLDEVEPIEYPKGTLMWAENNNNAYSEVPNRVNTIKSQPQTTNSKPKVNNSYKPSRTTSNSQVGDNEYAVKKGDSLWKIAQQYGTTVDALKAANPEIKGNMIYPNQIIKISNNKQNTSKSNKTTYTNVYPKENAKILADRYSKSKTNNNFAKSTSTKPKNSIKNTIYINDVSRLEDYANKYPVQSTKPISSKPRRSIQLTNFGQKNIPNELLLEALKGDKRAKYIVNTMLQQ